MHAWAKKQNISEISTERENVEASKSIYIKISLPLNSLFYKFDQHFETSFFLLFFESGIK